MARFAALFAQKIIDEIPRDAAKPRAQFFAFAQIAEPLPRGDKNFLRKVFAQVRIAASAVGEAANQPLVALDDAAECAGTGGRGSGRIGRSRKDWRRACAVMLRRMS